MGSAEAEAHVGLNADVAELELMWEQSTVTDAEIAANLSPGGFEGLWQALMAPRNLASYLQ